MVYLIGAGCGDEGLITVKGKEILEQADCIIYDRLLSPALLKDIKSDCECIYVGKENHHHTLKQDEINQLLINKANVYKTVVRLKGGDNYVFARGAEECIALSEQGIPFQIIPGIPSFIGALAYAGIPITHRGINTGIRIVTAHGKNGDKVQIDFSSIAKSKDTCVFMMGLSKLDWIVQSLLDHGKNENTPIALIQNGTFKNQRVLTSTLKNIREDFSKDPLGSPCLIVVGDVISLRPILDFYTRQKTIAFPRVSKDVSQLSTLLRLKGYQVHEFEVGHCIPTNHTFPSLEQYTHIIFSSKFGVDCFFQQCKKVAYDIRKLSHLKFCVIGKSTGNECIQYGIYPDYCPDIYTSEQLVQLLKEHIQSSDSILVWKAVGNEYKWKDLETICPVTYFDAYENIEIESNYKIQENAIVFTCSSAVERTCRKKLPENVKIFSIGPKTSETLSKYGYTYIQCEQADFNSLAECIELNLVF